MSLSDVTRELIAGVTAHIIALLRPGSEKGRKSLRISCAGSRQLGRDDNEIFTYYREPRNEPTHFSFSILRTLGSLPQWTGVGSVNFWFLSWILLSILLPIFFARPSEAARQVDELPRIFSRLRNFFFFFLFLFPLPRVPIVVWESPGGTLRTFATRNIETFHAAKLFF